MAHGANYSAGWFNPLIRAQVALVDEQDSIEPPLKLILRRRCCDDIPLGAYPGVFRKVFGIEMRGLNRLSQ